VQTLPGVDSYSDHNLRIANTCTRWNKIIRFRKEKPIWDLKKLYAQGQKVQDAPETKLGAIECAKWECGNALENYQEMC
jgi:hypothetical protein